MKTTAQLRFTIPCSRAVFFLVLVLQLVACSLWGQVVQKKKLTPADYPKWGLLELTKMDATGKWISYNMTYESGLDTLFIKNTKSLKIYPFPLGNRGDFINDNWFVCHTAKGIDILNLQTGKQENISGATQYVFSAASNSLLILVKEKEKENTLLIRQPEGLIIENIVGVNEFLMDPNGEKVLFSTTIKDKHSIGLLELGKKHQKTILIQSASKQFHAMVWQEEGKSLAFMQYSLDLDTTNSTLFYYDLPRKKLFDFDPKTQKDFASDSLRIPSSSYKLKISKDNNKVFFAVQQKTKLKAEDSTTASDVELWNANAKWIYPREKKRKVNEGTYLALWKPFQNHFQVISSAALPQFMLCGDQNYAILSNVQQYEPQQVYDGPRDFYLVDLKNGSRNLFLKKQSGHIFQTLASPAGKYIAYFKQGHWWVYNIAKKTHTNITKHLGTSFENDEDTYPDSDGSYLNLGWSLNDKEILIYDTYDLWAIAPDGSSCQRLTHGRETKTRFRLASTNLWVTPGKENYNGWMGKAIDLNQGLVLRANDNQGKFGYYKWTPSAGIKELISNDAYLDQFIGPTTDGSFAYREQRYDLAPRVMIGLGDETTPKVIFQSNPQQQQFHWGKSKLIQYQNSKGELLNGVLFYPANYDDKKKYPMIVHIYEKQSSELHKYVNPSEFLGDGFNISNFTSQGYFVFYPDITFEIGNPGLSAVDCVVAATKKVIELQLVLPDKIGLIGHSFGAYEANFILTQTNIFAAGVSGAGVSDLTSFYLTPGLTGRPDSWRFETQQWRMGKSLFEDKQGYDRNSPIVYAKNISTPLLSWTGSNDMQVDWHQSMEFYIALHRLGKKHIMLLYPNEEHALTTTANQKDLAVRINEWFDYYLKDMPSASWIKDGMKKLG